MRRTWRVNAHSHHSPLRPAGPRPSRDSCPLAKAKTPWPGHDRTEARKEATERDANGATSPWNTDPSDTLCVPDWKDLRTAALTAH
jgi:hypothetical protein